MNETPETFTLTITEQDRLDARDFWEAGKCLIATALRRLGYATATEYVTFAIVNDRIYDHPYTGQHDVHFLSSKMNAPFYGPEVVGKEIVFTLKARPDWFSGESSERMGLSFAVKVD